MNAFVSTTRERIDTGQKTVIQKEQSTAERAEFGVDGMETGQVHNILSEKEAPLTI